MDDIESVKTDSYVGTIKYRLNVPALSLANYQAASVMLVRYLYRGNRLRNIIQAIFTAVIFAVAILGSIPLILKIYGINLFATIWLDDDSWMMTFVTNQVLVILLYTALFGFFVFCLSVRRKAKKMRKKLYVNSSLIQSGYMLTLGDSGFSCFSQNMMNAIKWQEVGSVIRSNNMIYMLFRAGGFLWLPEDLEGGDTDTLCDFINSKIGSQ